MSQLVADATCAVKMRGCTSLSIRYAGEGRTLPHRLRCTASAAFPFFSFRACLVKAADCPRVYEKSSKSESSTLAHVLFSHIHGLVIDSCMAVTCPAAGKERDISSKSPKPESLAFIYACMEVCLHGGCKSGTPAATEDTSSNLAFFSLIATSQLAPPGCSMFCRRCCSTGFEPCTPAPYFFSSAFSSGTLSAKTLMAGADDDEDAPAVWNFPSHLGHAEIDFANQLHLGQALFTCPVSPLASPWCVLSAVHQPWSTGPKWHCLHMYAEYVPSDLRYKLRICSCSTASMPPAFFTLASAPATASLPTTKSRARKYFS
mmetsp:Transcript_27220/g.53012  ORF Transcript_27220/g.53012 Transcript_27220/m.53012 type:complete len:317 (+) Transcript_27220:17-967(+)